MNQQTAFRITPRLIVGFGILLLGMLWTLDNLQVLDADPLLPYLPGILVVIGLAQLADRRAHRVGPVVLIVLGVLLVLRNLDRIDFRMSDLIPLGIALLGAKLVWDAVARRQGRAIAGDPDSVIHAFAMMAGVKRKSTSVDFRGGDANAIMGGVELDLRNAQIADGANVIIDAFAMWGGIEMQVPPNWRIVGDVLPIMASFQDHTRPTAEPGPTVTIRGTAIMGGIEVKN